MHPFRPPRNVRPRFIGGNPMIRNVRPPYARPFGYNHPRAHSPGFQEQRFPPPRSRNPESYPSRVPSSPSDSFIDHSRSNSVSNRSIETAKKQIIEYGHSNNNSRKVIYEDNGSGSYNCGYSKDQRRVGNYGHGCNQQEVDYSVVGEPYQTEGYRDGFWGVGKPVTDSRFDRPVGGTYDQTYPCTTWTDKKPTEESDAQTFLKNWERMTKPFLYKDKIDDQSKDSSSSSQGLGGPVLPTTTPISMASPYYNSSSQGHFVLPPTTSSSASSFNYSSQKEGPMLSTTTPKSSLPVSSPVYKSPSQGHPQKPTHNPLSFVINSSKMNKSPGLNLHEVPTTKPLSSALTSGLINKSPSLGPPEVPTNKPVSYVHTSGPMYKSPSLGPPEVPTTKPVSSVHTSGPMYKSPSLGPHEVPTTKPVSYVHTSSPMYKSPSLGPPEVPTTRPVSSVHTSGPMYKSPSLGPPEVPTTKPVSYVHTSGPMYKSPSLGPPEVPTTKPVSYVHTSGPMYKSPSLGPPEVPKSTPTSAVSTSVVRGKGSVNKIPSATNNPLTDTKQVGDKSPRDYQGNKLTNNSSQNGEEAEQDKILCVVCNVYMANQAAKKSHENGMLHSSRIKAAQNKSKQSAENNSSQMPDTASSSSTASGAKQHVTNQTSADSASISTNKDAASDEEDVFSCTYCNMTFSGADRYARHTRGMLHTQNLMAAEAGKQNNQSEEGPFKTVKTVSALEETKDIVVRTHSHREHIYGSKGQDTEDGDEDSYHFETSNWMAIDEELHGKKPVDERDLDPDEIGKQMFSSEYHCMICDINCNSEDGYQMHLQGSKHKSKITSQKNAERLLGLKKTESEDCPAELEPRASIYELLEKSSVPLLGLNYVTEYQDPFSSKQNRYVCNLCEAKCDCNTIVCHLTGAKHRLRYFKENRADVYEHLAKHTSMKKKTALNKFMDDIAQEIFQKEGLQSMKVKKASELIPDEAQVLQLLTQKGIFKPEVAKIITQLTESKESVPSAEKRSLESPGPSNVKKRKTEEENEELEPVDDNWDHYAVRCHGDGYDDQESRSLKRKHDDSCKSEDSFETKREVFDYGHSKVKIIDYGHKASREEPESKNPSKTETVVDDEKERLFEEFLEWKKFKEYVSTKKESSSQMKAADGEPTSSQQAPPIQETSLHSHSESQSSFVKGQGQDNYHLNHPYNRGHIDNVGGQMSVQGHVNVSGKETFQSQFGNIQFPGNVQGHGTFGNNATNESHLNVHNSVNVQVPHHFSQNVTGIQGQQLPQTSTSAQKHQNYNTASGSFVQEQVKGQGQESSSQGGKNDTTKEEEASIAVSNIKDTIGRLSSSLIKSEDEAALVLEMSNALTQSLLQYRLKTIPEEVQLKITNALDKAKHFQSEQKSQGTGKQKPKQNQRLDSGYSLPVVQTHKHIESMASGISHLNSIGKAGKPVSSQQNISPLSVTTINRPTLPIGTELKLAPVISKDQPTGSGQLRTNPALQKHPSFQDLYPTVSGYTGMASGIPTFPNKFKETHKTTSSASNQSQWQQTGNFSGQKMRTHSQQTVPSGYNTSRVSDIKITKPQPFQPPLPPPPFQPPLPPPRVQPPLPPLPAQPPLPSDHRKMKPPSLPSRYIP